jgi:hypothetical protein
MNILEVQLNFFFWLCDKFKMFYIVALQDVEVTKAQVV